MELARTIAKITAPLARRVRLMARRAVVKLVYDDVKMQELQLAIFSGEVRDRVERWEDYGLTSHPIPGAEALVLALGGSTDHSAVVKVGDRRYRLVNLAEGEVALYDDQGQVIHLKRDKHIHVYGAKTLTADVADDVIVNTTRAAVNASESCIVTSPLVKAVASTQVLLDTPLTECTGNLLVAGGISSSGTFGDTGGKIQTPGDIESGGDVKDSVRTMADDRGIYNGHTHPGDSGGSTGAPNQQQ
ncbi:phage baseplate assembly protein V [Pseudomonas sp.]|uniref:phage baseplate assembly protein V n=1 Tax=Pseudomonas sp. TaxID=306 RepID=UPI003D100303